eukprot:6771999-Pyramimonas_sp.AAC.1
MGRLSKGRPPCVNPDLSGAFSPVIRLWHAHITAPVGLAPNGWANGRTKHFSKLERSYYDTKAFFWGFR